ncbi:MAG: NADH-quinone oxidoreductase subunit J [Micrococcales bacterium]|nr:NADH-quinone oxidoreductase subunit J [Micrococcales bacterium]
MSPQLLSAGASLTMSTSELWLFWTVAPVVVLGALALLFARRPVIVACSVMITMVGLAFLYVGLGAPFLGVVQVVVYTGAIMMLFVFVLMLVGVDASDSSIETIRGQRWIGIILGLGLLVVLGGAALRATWNDPVGVAPMNAAEQGGNPGGLAKVLFSDFAFTLEVVGTLLIIAAMGAVIMTHRQRIGRRIGQRERAARAVATGKQIAMLPGPGVFARHNAADIPALDADGQQIDDSVATVVRMRGQTHRLHGLAEDLLPPVPPTNVRAAGPPVEVARPSQDEGEEQP